MKETIAYQLTIDYYSWCPYVFHEVTEEILRDFFCNTDWKFYDSVFLALLDAKEGECIVDVCLTKEEDNYKLLVTDNEGDATTYTLYPVKLIGGL